MARKWCIFLHPIQSFLRLWIGELKSLLKVVYVRCQDFRRLLVFSSLVLGTAILCVIFVSAKPSFSHINLSSSQSQIKNSTIQTENQLQQGKALYDAGQFAEALMVLEQAAATFKATGDRLNEAMALSNISLVYQQLGQWNQAEKAIAQSLNLLKNGDRSTQHFVILAQALDVQGRLQLAQGQTQAALSTWLEAATIYKQIGDEATIIRNRINSAQAMQALGLYRQASMVLKEVEQSLTNLPDSELKATGLRSLGNLLRVVGDLSLSRDVLEQSLAVATKVQSSTAIGDTLLSLGNTAFAQGKTQRNLDNKDLAEKETQAALKYYQEAARVAQPVTSIQAQLNQLSLVVEKERFPDALTLVSQIQPYLSKLPPDRNSIYSRINFVENVTKLKQKVTTDTPSWLDIAQLLSTAVEQARSLKDRRAESYALGTLGGLYEQTKQLTEAKNITKEALLIAQTLEPQDIAYQWQWQLGRLLKQEGDIKGAIALYQQAFKTLESLRRDLVAMNPEIQFSFRETVEPVYRELVDLQLRTKGNSETTQYNLIQARNVIESLQLAELNNFFRSPCVETRVKIDTVVQQDKEAAILYPIVLPDRIEVILTLPEQKELRKYTTVISQENVENTVQDLRKSLVDVAETFQVQQKSQEIYEWLIRPAEAELTKMGIKTLVFVLDSSLQNIPMGVLYDRQQQKYLIEKYAIALTPGLQLFDPKPLQKVQLNALIAGVGEQRFGFPPLQNVARELKEIQSEVPRSEELLNQQFTDKNLQKELQSAPVSVVHLATHGEFSSDPEKTFILTWDKLLKVRDFDNLLRVSKSSRSSNIELLVLSACKTALGDKRAALGLAGVAVRAGARSTLASLWSVDDQSTADLMSEFYRQLKTGVSKAQALQHAQLAIFAKDNSPYHWAPYVLLGNWL
ncbi:MAG: CHAT domain-containing protein [Scytonema sp. PMC 1069.18]|nr:CHAT domain-containing protein [Scytonema sp. PMC 1069.18]MEC4879751.1 CHAT domain-containing protein [Scytonema sp. PMC 1070.18]